MVDEASLSDRCRSALWPASARPQARATEVAATVQGDVAAVVGAIARHAEEPATQRRLAEMLSEAMARDMSDERRTITTIASSGGIEQVRVRRTDDADNASLPFEALCSTEVRWSSELSFGHVLDPSLLRAQSPQGGRQARRTDGHSSL